MGDSLRLSAGLLVFFSRIGWLVLENVTAGEIVTPERLPLAELPADIELLLGPHGILPPPR